MNTQPPFDFACPICKTRLEAIAPNQMRCPSDATTFCQIDGIWRMMRPERIGYFEQFVKEYETVRQAEMLGSDESTYYRALPFADLTGRISRIWEIRAASFRALIENVIAPLEKTTVLKILDLGAGNGWLSYQLAKRGHMVGAIDLLTNKTDGLGTHIHYDSPFTPIQAEFDHLPLTAKQVDVAIFNSSFHYAVNYETALGEAWRVVKQSGSVVILDSPVYSDCASGKQMVREREQQFQRRYGFPSNSIASEGFLTFKRLDALAASAGTQWRIVAPRYGWRWTIRQWLVRLRARREPAQFMLIIGTRAAPESVNLAEVPQPKLVRE